MGCGDGIDVTWEGKFLSLILQKQGEEDGWMAEKAGLGDTGDFSAKDPTRIRMKGQGSMAAEGFQLWLRI